MRFACWGGDETMQDIHVCNEMNEDVWRNFVETEPEGNVFHTPELYRVFTGAERHRPHLWAATDASGTPLALFLPVDINVLNGILGPWTSRAVAYGGILCAEGPARRRAVMALLTAYRRARHCRALTTELRHLSNAASLGAALGRNGFVHEEHLNYLIRLDRPEADLWLGLSRTARQRIRSAKKKGVLVEEFTDASKLDEVYQLIQHVYSRARVPLAGPSLFRTALLVLRPRGMLRIFAARLDDQLIAVRFVLLCKGRMVDWYAASDRRFASYSPSELLVWHALCWGQQHDFRIFDFGGAGRPDEQYGPRDFKAKFGGDMVNFGRDVLVHAPVRFRVSRAGYAVTRRVLWGHPATAKRGPA
jgi:CelD/BcsL family acetyltransferase involved in cellulose biosynthesis